MSPKIALDIIYDILCMWKV